MKIVTAAEMREIDRITTERHGIPSLTLMENAGTAVAEFALREYPQAQSFGVICGKGNNGGDGLVAARKLHEAGREVRVLLLADPGELKGEAAAMRARLPVKAVVARTEDQLKGEKAQQILAADVLVDAILGTGFKLPVTGFYGTAIQAICDAQKKVVSVDLPSGCDADAVAEEAGVPRSARAISNGIVTFTAPKLAHVFGRQTDGPIVVAPIGTPPEAIESELNLEVITDADVSFLNLTRRHDSHKGDFGHVLVVGGSVGKAGAAAMAGMAALRAGAGLVTVATPGSVLPTVSGFAPELMTEPLDETEGGTVSLRALDRMEKLMAGKNVLAIGPGLSRHPETAEFVRTVVAKTKLPVVLDADGLNAFEGHGDEFDGSQRLLVVTPHPGEMARLTGLTSEQIQKDRVGTARKFASDHNCIVVLKGWRTLIAQPDGDVWVNTTGNPGMATGGTGDVLTGIVASLLAQYSGEHGASRVFGAVYLHGLAGDLARDELGEHSMTATDLLRFLPRAFRATRERAEDQIVRIG